MSFPPSRAPTPMPHRDSRIFALPRFLLLLTSCFNELLSLSAAAAELLRVQDEQRSIMVAIKET